MTNEQTPAPAATDERPAPQIEQTQLRLWDVVTLRIEKCAVKSHWEPLCKIRGVIVDIPDADTARIIWTEDCGLSMHWQLDTLRVVRERNPHLDERIAELHAPATPEAAGEKALKLDISDEWLQERAAREAECVSVAVGAPATAAGELVNEMRRLAEAVDDCEDREVRYANPRAKEDFTAWCRRNADTIVAALEESAAVKQELDHLAKFKSYVHQRLDDAGIPVDPDSPEGCRIGGRLDWVLSAIERLSALSLASADDLAATREQTKAAEAKLKVNEEAYDRAYMVSVAAKNAAEAAEAERDEARNMARVWERYARENEDEQVAELRTVLSRLVNDVRVSCVPIDTAAASELLARQGAKA